MPLNIYSLNDTSYIYTFDLDLIELTFIVQVQCMKHMPSFEQYMLLDFACLQSGTIICSMSGRCMSWRNWCP